MKTKQYAYNTTGDMTRPLSNITVGMPYADDRGDTLYPLIDRRNGRTVGYTFDATLADDIAAVNGKNELTERAGTEIESLLCRADSWREEAETLLSDMESLLKDRDTHYMSMYGAVIPTAPKYDAILSALSLMASNMRDAVSLAAKIEYDELTPDDI